MNDLSLLRRAIVEGEAAASIEAARQALKDGFPPLELITGGISPAMAETGKLFEQGEYFVPELLMSARATREIFQIIRPLLAAGGTEPTGHIVLGTVQGDLHDIGKNLVSAMLEGGGFEITDLGVDVSPAQFVEAVRTRPAQVVGLSAMLTTTMPAMKRIIEALLEAGVRDKVKVIVGGAPVTKAYAEAIGADGYGESAATCVDLVRRMISA